MMHDRREMVRTQVETATTMVKAIAEEARAGKMSMDEAQRVAKSLLTSMRFNETDYFVVIDSDPANQGVVVTHPNAKIVGKNLWSAKDANGSEYVIGQIEAARAGGGFNDYDYPRLGETERWGDLGRVGEMWGDCLATARRAQMPELTPASSSSLRVRHGAPHS